MEPDEDDPRDASPNAYDVSADFTDSAPINGSSNPFLSDVTQTTRAPTRGTTKVHRRINTCAPCQTAKRGCDRLRPCQHCKQRNIVDRCKYASDATEPLDTKQLSARQNAVENLLRALYNSFGIPTEVREAIAQSPDGPENIAVDLSSYLNQRRTSPAITDNDHDRMPATGGLGSVQPPKWHMTVYSFPPPDVDVDPASRVFGATSIFINLDELLGTWSETLGLHMRAFAAHDPRAPLGEMEQGETSDVHLTAVHSEFDQHRGWRGRQNLGALYLAYQLFVAPSLFPSQGPPQPLINVSHAKLLPPAPLRYELWNEFDSMMVLHMGLNTPEFKRRVESVFDWADWELTGQQADMGRPAAPSLAFYAVVTTALAIGAQSKEVKEVHRAAGQAKGQSPESGDMSGLPNHAPVASAASPASSQGDSTGSWDANPGLQHPPGHSAHDLHNLSEAARLAHDQLDLPPSLDYIVAHMYSWIYLLHPANVISYVSDSPGSVRGGGPIGVDSRIWKSLGKVVNVARGMGLGIDPDSEMAGGETHAHMKVWEKEMRRRVWWELCYYDALLAECMGQTTLIDSAAYDCQVPSDVDECNFNPSSTTIPAPNGSTTTHNISHFVSRCRLIQIAKRRKRYPLDDRSQLDKCIESAKKFEKQIVEFKASLPSHLRIKGLPDTGDDSWMSFQNVKYPVTDIMAMQACDLYRMADVVLMSLWQPFLFPSLDSSQPRQWPGFACTAAASAIVTGADHVRKSLRDLRPANLGYLALGRSVFLAGCLSATVVIRGHPEMPFIETALKSIHTSINICKDPVICGIGRPDPKTYRFETGRVLDLLSLKADNTWRTTQGSLGTKRKDVEGFLQGEVLKLRGGYELPYSGRGVITTPCTLKLDYAPYRRLAPMEIDTEELERGRRGGSSGGGSSKGDIRPMPSRPPPPAPSASFASKTRSRSRSRSNGSETSNRTSRPNAGVRVKGRSDSAPQPPPAALSAASSASSLSRLKTGSSETLRKTAQPRKRASQESVGAVYHQRSGSASLKAPPSSNHEWKPPIHPQDQPFVGYPGGAIQGTFGAPQQQNGQPFMLPMDPLGPTPQSYPGQFQPVGPGYAPVPSPSSTSPFMPIESPVPFDAPAYRQDRWSHSQTESPNKPMVYPTYALEADPLQGSNGGDYTTSTYMADPNAVVQGQYGQTPPTGGSQAFDQQYRNRPAQPQQPAGPSSATQYNGQPGSVPWADFNGVGGNQWPPQV